MRKLLTMVPEAFIAVSCSKAFSLYSERTGAAIIVGNDRTETGPVIRTIEGIARASYSQPPHHGAAIVAEILSDKDLRVMWSKELDMMRDRITSIRTALVTAISEHSHDVDLAALAAHRGMFSTLPLDEAGMDRLRAAGFHGTPSGRINIAGLPRTRVEQLAAAIATASTSTRVAS